MEYITSVQLKATLEIDTTYADADIAIAISAACQSIENYKNTRFYPTYETRYYTPEARIGVYPYTEDSIPTDEFNASTAVTVAVDIVGDGSYGSTWVQGTDYYLDPANADLTGRPFNRITIRQQSGRVFPTWQRAVRVQASFGWATWPPQVTEATTILASRYLKRARETPYGLLTIVGDGVAAARLGKIDPDIAFLLNLDGSPPQLIA